MKTRLTLAFFLLILSSCDLFEMRGFFTSYENVNDRFDQSLAWNDLNGPTIIDVNQDDYTILAMGDSHVGGTTNLDTFFKDAQDLGTTAVIMAGDITTGHKEDYDEFATHLPANATLTSFGIAGNHDLYFDGWQHFYSIFGSSSYTFVVNTTTASDLFICLDTGGGTLGNKQLSWLKNILATQRTNYRYCTIVTHNNIFRLRPTTSTNPMVEEVQVLADLSIKHNISMVITGHDHKRNTAVLGNTTHIIMDALQDISKNASYLKLSINDAKIDYSFIELN